MFKYTPRYVNMVAFTPDPFGKSLKFVPNQIYKCETTSVPKRQTLVLRKQVENRSITGSYSRLL